MVVDYQVEKLGIHCNQVNGLANYPEDTIFRSFILEIMMDEGSRGGRYVTDFNKVSCQ